jgi:hypothetical protein
MSFFGKSQTRKRTTKNMKEASGTMKVATTLCGSGEG